MTFEELEIREDLLHAIKDMGFEKPMPVQEKVIPHLLHEDGDVVALAQTGTGKTAAFGLPVIQRTDTSLRQPQALIISPTRELCLQIGGDLADFSKYTSGLSVLPVYGGSSIESQIRTLRKGVQIIVATPGRLLDLIKRGEVNLSGVHTVILDEADEMLNMGFLDDINAILDNVEAGEKYTTSPVYPGSYAAQTPADEQVKQPTILYVMDESYWDVSELEQYGFQFDTDVSANLHALQQTSAYGRGYSPSFGGGTCDVEFEALTGYSVSYLPSGSKPFQQRVTKPMFALPSYLKPQGYQTAAVHCFWARYWSRDTAYPNLGLDDFISLEKMHGVQKVRRHYWTTGLVTDDSMADQIIGQYETMKAQSDAPVFLHAVTMQNHTNYNKDNYPDDQRVKVTEAPAGLKASTVGALEDFATGIRDADAMLGRLTDYFSQVDEPVILVFWGDHYNPIDSNYDIYTRSGYASGSSADPRLHQTTLLMWSNYSDRAVDLGTIAAYDISPVMMELFGLRQPAYFQFLGRQLRAAYRANTRGTILEKDGTASTELTPLQQKWSDEHWLLQYDLMFGKGYALSRMGLESIAEGAD